MTEKHRNRMEKLLSRVCDVFILLFFGFYMLFPPFLGYARTTDVKYIVFLAVCGSFVAICLLLSVSWRLVTLGEDKKPRLHKSLCQRAVHTVRNKTRLFTLLIFGYLFFSVVSLILSPYEGTMIGYYRNDGLLTQAIYVFLAYFILKYYRPKRWILVPFALSVSVFCAVGVLQLCGVNVFGMFPAGYAVFDGGSTVSTMFFSMTGNVDFGAALLSLSGGILMGALVTKKAKYENLFFPALALTVYTLVKMDVQAGLVALGAGTAVVGFLGVRTRRELLRYLQTVGTVITGFACGKLFYFAKTGFVFQWNLKTGLLLSVGTMMMALFGCLEMRCAKRTERGFSVVRYRRVTGLLFGAALVGGIGVLYFYNGWQSGSLYEIHETLHGRAQSTFGTGRFYIWQETLQRIWEHPFFGTGPDTLSQRGIPPFRRYIEATQTEKTASVDVAHNEYLNIWVNEGGFALLAYLGAITVAFLLWIRKETNAMTTVMGCGILFYLICAFFDISVFMTTPFLWVSLGVLMASVKEEIS